MDVIVIYEGEDACTQCLGWKRVDDGDDAGSWKYWEELPYNSAVAIRLGLVKPIECPRCHGSGVEPSTRNDSEDGGDDE